MVTTGAVRAPRRGATVDVHATLAPLWRGLVLYRVVALAYAIANVVRFADLTDEEIETYVATGEPLRVAGAFTIDGLGGPYVRAIEGDHHAVVGVSLPVLRDLLGQLNIAWHSLRS